MCCHLEPAYAGAGTWRAASSLAASESSQSSAIMLPFFADATDAELEIVRSALIGALVAVAAG
jgi:hypothetical protein